ncbi:MAG: hypothetical protein COT74_11075 [Bdellovibrionales bacterium CG10_big_fil_rev_8_21_14_0_10_45_34]|nr:MAG: hypothetical protein COT74_11075 [Bdellovibrionales bacterium CG10_big_fil_rev_8_21_14_0_10_45_34]
MSQLLSQTVKRIVKSIPGTNRVLRMSLRILRKQYWRHNLRRENLAEIGPNFPNQLFWSQTELIQIMSPPGTTVLELGCQNGKALHAAAIRFPGSKFLGVDISREAIAAAKALTSQKPTENVAWFAGDIFEFLKANTEPIHVLCSCATLIYFSEKELEQLLSVLRDRGLKALALCEVTARGQRSVKEHIYAHNYEAIIAKVFGKKNRGLNYSKTPFKYEPWESQNFEGAIHFFKVSATL